MLRIFKKPISISLSPNTEKDDIFLALRLCLSFKNWKKGKEIKEIEEKFKDFLGVKEAISFNSGRSAFLSILSSLDLKEGDEILLQAFTCNSAVNPILHLRLKPLFVDCDETFNLSFEDLKRKITKKSKVVIIQHTFGQPAKIDEILKICQKHNLILIEDCAHSLGAEYKGKKVGTFGKAAFFSFSRDKVISSVYGGMAVTSDERIAKKIRDFQRKCTFPSNFWILQQLLHPILINYLILPLYRFPHFGKIMLNILQTLRILSKAVHKKEKKGKFPSYFPKRLPRALASLALNQFKKLEKFNTHREKIAKIYIDNLKGKFEFQKEIKDTKRIFMKFPLLINRNTDEILKKGRRKKILLDDGWRKSPVVPPDTDLKKMQYSMGSCPNAEKIAKRILNLPTHINISFKEAQRIINFLNSLF